MKKKIIVSVFAAITMLFLAAVPAGASTRAPAKATTGSVVPRIVGGITDAFSGPTPYSSLVGGFPNGTQVTMYCWTDNAWAYGTNRWFWVGGIAWNPFSGNPELIYAFVSANRVWPQTTVGHCH